MISDNTEKSDPNVLGKVCDLSNYYKLGVLYFYDLPTFPAESLCSPDGFKWCSFPTDLNPKFRGHFGLSFIMVALRYLNIGAFIKITYKILNSGIAIARIYILPEGIVNTHDMILFCSRCLSFDRTSASHHKIYSTFMARLLSIIDYDPDAWKINSDLELSRYLEGHMIAVIDCLMPFREFKTISQLITECFRSMRNWKHLSQENVLRLCRRKPLNKNLINQCSSLTNESKHKGLTIEKRLIKIYDGLQSPKIDLRPMDSYMRQSFENILHNSITGFKSALYGFQRESVSKMYQMEIETKSLPMPTIVRLPNGMNWDVFLNLMDLEFTISPWRYFTPRGGILAENMGLGKTCICLALICLSKTEVSRVPSDAEINNVAHPHIQSLLETCVHNIVNKSIDWRKFADDLPETCRRKLQNTIGSFTQYESPEITHKRLRELHYYRDDNISILKKQMYLSSSTLIVVPNNLFPQWIAEINKHVSKNFLKILKIPTVKTSIPDNIRTILAYDIVLISATAFHKACKPHNSIFFSIYWKRFIIDEGHSMTNKSTALNIRSIMSERRWAITGTLTSGLTNLHMEGTDDDYIVRKRFNAATDLNKIGCIISNFLQIDPWYSHNKMWNRYVSGPFKREIYYSDFQLKELLSHLIVRHSMNDIHKDIVLPKLHHRATILKPSFFDRLSINLFIAVLAVNAVTSNREGVDFMFSQSNRTSLRRLINNLQKATFYWTGFSVGDITNLLNICKFSLKENENSYSESDKKLLMESIYVSKVALSNNRWRATSSVHEMSYFVANLPPWIRNNYTISQFVDRHDCFGAPVGVYGFPQLIAIQRFYYKNRFIKNELELAEKMKESTKLFWESYGRTNDKLNDVHRHKVLNQELDFTSIDFKTVKEIEKLPSWVSRFDPVKEEPKAIVKVRKFSKTGGNNGQFKRKHAIDSTSRKRPRSAEHILKDSKYKETEKLGSMMRFANILGTASVKLSYLTSRLIENEIKGQKSIVFYEFENSAYYLTELLDILGINYFLYSPHIAPLQRSQNLIDFDEWDTHMHFGHGVALVMDLKLAAHGLTILSATNVFFINPVWSKSVEAQAIKRAHRIGQTHEVFVETLILKDTIEEEMYKNRQMEKKKPNNTVDTQEKEMIDNIDIQDYIMQFKFLGLYDKGYGTTEISPIESRSELNESLKSDAYAINLNDLNYNNAELPCLQSETKSDGIRRWITPLFTQNSMTKLSESDAKTKSKNAAKGREKFMKPEQNSKGAKNWNDKGRETANLMRKLKQTRKVHFSTQ